MAQIQEDGGGNAGKKGKKRAKKGSTAVDMTPLVDLAFLLLTFFVMTSTFSKPKVMSLAYPAKKNENVKAENTEVNNAITFLISEDRLFYYENQFYPLDNKEGVAPTQLTELDMTTNEVRSFLKTKNAATIQEVEKVDEKLQRGEIADTTHKQMVSAIKSGYGAPKVIVKTDDLAKCKHFIGLIDELQIAKIGVVAPMEISSSEMDLLKTKL